MTDYAQEQMDEVEALESILMEDMVEVDGQSSEGLGTDSRCFMITIKPMDEGEDEPTEIPVRMSFVFAHTPEYPDEPPLIKIRSIRGVRDNDLARIQSQLEQETQDNLGMAMIFTLAQSAKEQLRDVVCGEAGGPVVDERAAQIEREEKEKAAKEAARLGGTPVTEETWNAWFERFRADEALEKAKVASATDFKSKNKSSGKQYFESGKGMDEDDMDDADFEGLDDEFDDMDDDLLDEFLEQTETDALTAGQQVHYGDDDE